MSPAMLVNQSESACKSCTVLSIHPTDVHDRDYKMFKKVITPTTPVARVFRPPSEVVGYTHIRNVRNICLFILRRIRKAVYRPSIGIPSFFVALKVSLGSGPRS
jgi:hypothetical protein